MKYLFFSNRFIEWTNRILLSINIMSVGFTCPDHYYPLVVLSFTTIALWLYFFKIKTLSIPILLLALYINFDHLLNQSFTNNC